MSSLVPIDPLELAPLGLRVNALPSLEQWSEFGLFLKRANTAIQMAIGDWITVGQTLGITDIYDVAVGITGYDYGYLRNCHMYASTVPLSVRRDNATLEHYKAVYRLTPPEQADWLDEADEYGLSAAELERRVLASQGKPPPTNLGLVNHELTAENHNLKRKNGKLAEQRDEATARVVALEATVARLRVCPKCGAILDNEGSER